MSIMSHLLYDEQQSALYRREAEAIIYDLSGLTAAEAESLGMGRAYRMALTEALRCLTLYDLCHQVSTIPVSSCRGVRIAQPEERRSHAAEGAGDILRKNGWNQSVQTA